MKLPNPPAEYDASTERARNRLLTAELEQVRRRGQDLELRTGERLILSSPDGARWALTVDNAGVISAVAL
jgi:hypothetical protein